MLYFMFGLFVIMNIFLLGCIFLIVDAFKRESPKGILQGIVFISIVFLTVYLISMEEGSKTIPTDQTQTTRSFIADGKIIFNPGTPTNDYPSVATAITALDHRFEESFEQHGIIAVEVSFEAQPGLPEMVETWALEEIEPWVCPPWNFYQAPGRILLYYGTAEDNEAIALEQQLACTAIIDDVLRGYISQTPAGELDNREADRCIEEELLEKGWYIKRLYFRPKTLDWN